MNAEFLQIALPVLLRGALTTLIISLVSVSLGLLIGLGICQMMRSNRRLFRIPALIYVSALRGIPVLVILMLLFYLPSSIGIELPSLLVAVMALSMNTGAFQAEIFRAGFTAIPKGQIEAAKALGLGPGRIFRRILIPQVLGLTLPELVNEIIILLKNSSLISVIAVTELMRCSEQLVSTTYRPAEIYIMAACMYLIMNICISLAGSRAYAHFTGWTQRR